MSRVFVTGSVSGLGRAAAAELLSGGHEVVIHGRDRGRLAEAADLVERGAVAVVGDLSDPTGPKAVAEQVNELGHMDSVIHNAGVYSGPSVLAVNVLAPYLLTALIEKALAPRLSQQWNAPQRSSGPCRARPG